MVTFCFQFIKNKKKSDYNPYKTQLKAENNDNQKRKSLEGYPKSL